MLDNENKTKEIVLESEQCRGTSKSVDNEAGRVYKKGEASREAFETQLNSDTFARFSHLAHDILTKDVTSRLNSRDPDDPEQADIRKRVAMVRTAFGTVLATQLKKAKGDYGLSCRIALVDPLHWDVTTSHTDQRERIASSDVKLSKPANSKASAPAHRAMEAEIEHLAHLVGTRVYWRQRDKSLLLIAGDPLPASVFSGEDNGESAPSGYRDDPAAV